MGEVSGQGTFEPGSGSAEEAGIGGEGPGAPLDLSKRGLRESHALLVGVTRYEDRSGWPSLPGVREDVSVVASALQEHGLQVRILRDPSKGELEDAMDEFFFTTPKSPASRSVFYYAGQGATLKTNGGHRGFPVPSAAPSAAEDSRSFWRHAVSMARFQEYANESPARHVMFLFDSCFSGTVFEVVRSGVTRGSVKERIREKSRVFVAAGDADQEVPDESLFRRAFVHALEGRGT